MKPDKNISNETEEEKMQELDQICGESYCETCIPIYDLRYIIYDFLPRLPQRTNEHDLAYFSILNNLPKLWSISIKIDHLQSVKFIAIVDMTSEFLLDNFLMKKYLTGDLRLLNPYVQPYREPFLREGKGVDKAVIFQIKIEYVTNAKYNFIISTVFLDSSNNELISIRNLCKYHDIFQAIHFVFTMNSDTFKIQEKILVY